MKKYKPAVTGSRLILQFLLTAVAIGLAACAGPTGTVPTMISVQVAPATANVGTNQTQQFTATVSGTTNTAVSWQVSSTSASAASIGTINASGLYTSPANVPTGGTVTVIATSQADTTKTGTAVVTVTAPPAVTVTVSPKTATVTTGLTQQFSASVTNTSNTAVTWQVNGVNGGSATTGTISATGLYTAAATVPAGAVTVKAISQADNTKSDTATVTVVLPVSVTMSPKTASVQAGLTKQFTATVANTSNTAVTWQVNSVTGGNFTVGTVSASGLYTAPTTVPASNPVTVKAISVADNTKSDTATVTITAAVTVTVSPKTATVVTSTTKQFTATVTNTSNTSVTWQVNNVTGGSATTGTISATGLYTAPAAVPAGAVTVKAISVADNTKSDTAAVTVTLPVSVTVSPKTPSVQVALTQQFTAAVANTSNTAVTWQVNSVTGGNSTTGTISATGLFTAPATVPASNPVTVKAISVADNTKSDTATVTITPAPSITVTVTPKRGGLTPGQTMTFTPTVTGSSNTAVTWEVDTVPGGNGTVGVISTGGVYTAPNSGGVHNVVARSVADTTATSAPSPIGVTDLAGVFTYHNDNSRTGTNAKEYALTTTNVTTTTFGQMFSCSVDAAIYAQPLWVANVSISGVNHNVVYVATQHDSVYAFDADGSSCTNVWGGAKSLLGASETWVSSSDQSGCGDLVPDIGIVGTPVIDSSSNTLYVVARSKNGTTFHQRLHALDLATGAEKFSGPTDIQATVNGTGNGSSGGKLNFDVKIHNQRPALLLTGGHIIITWASHCDFGPYHGWVMSYGAGTLTQEAVFNVSPNGTLGGIWMAGGGPAADSSGNIFLATGNGSWTGTDAFGDSIVRLGPPSSGQFGSLDYFTPTNQLDLENGDRDLGSGGVLLLPTLSSGAHTQLLVQVGKEGKVYVADRQNLGQIFCTTSTLGNPCSSSDPQLVQELPSATGNMFATPAFWNNNVYFGGVNDDLKAYSFNQAGTGLLSNTFTSRTSSGFNFPGTTPSVSAQGTVSGTGILWAINTANNGTDGTTLGAAVLHAYDATNLATELWNSTKVAGDAAGNAVKFTVPTIANGKVYVGESGTLTVYGLKP